MPASTLLFSWGTRNQQDSNKAWAVWGLFKFFFGNRQEGKHTEFLQCNVFVFLLLQHITLESSSCMKCPPRTSSEHPGLGSCVGSTAAEGHWNPVPPEASNTSKSLHSVLWQKGQTSHQWISSQTFWILEVKLKKWIWLFFSESTEEIWSLIF